MARYKRKGKKETSKRRREKETHESFLLTGVGVGGLATALYTAFYGISDDDVAKFVAIKYRGSPYGKYAEKYGGYFRSLIPEKTFNTYWFETASQRFYSGLLAGVVISALGHFAIKATR